MVCLCSSTPASLPETTTNCPCAAKCICSRSNTGCSCKNGNCCCENGNCSTKIESEKACKC